MATLVINVHANSIVVYDNIFSASVKDDFQCTDFIEIFVTAPNKMYFEGRMIEAQKFFASARGVIGFDCPGIKSVKIKGLVADKIIFQGFSKESSGWDLQKFPPRIQHKVKKVALTTSTSNDQNVKEEVKRPVDDGAKFKGDLIFSNDRIRVYSRPPRVKTFMRKTRQYCDGFDIEYDFAHADRGRYLTSQYLARILFPLARECERQHSGLSLDREDTVKVYYYKNGEKHYWDLVYYYFPVRNWSGTTAKFAEIKHRYLGGAAKTQQNKSDSSYLGECAAKGPFCDLPGGKYLNAIYRNDTRTIDAMDSKYALRTDSLLVHIANQYMYDYDRKTYTGNYLNTAAKCFESKARTKTFSMTTDVVNYETLSGLDAGSVGGDRVASTYTVNAEFYPLLLKIGSHLGGDIEKTIAQGLNLKGMAMALKGAKQLQIKYSCKSDEVKQFEKNLISLTDRFLKKKNYRR